MVRAKEYKKSGESFTRALITIEAAKVCPGFCLSMGASLELAGYAIAFAGSREQVERWALPICVAVWVTSAWLIGSDLELRARVKSAPVIAGVAGLALQ